MRLPFGAATDSAWLAIVLLAAVGFTAAAQDTNNAGTNTTPATNAPAKAPASEGKPAADSGVAPRADSTSPRLDESAFRIVSERNIFDANRSGGQVRLSSRRAARVESFKLVGTIAYEKGAFAFFEGSSSELTKVLKPEGVIAGHKLVDILADGVKLEADGKTMDLAVGSAMRREDEGAWRPGDAAANSGSSSSRRDDEDSSRSRRGGDRDNRSSSSERAAANSSGSSADQAEVLKRLMEKREKE
jgi:hypothetical protein